MKSRLTDLLMLEAILMAAAVLCATNENEVWVNTRSGKYWKPGSHFYGKTKQAEFMTESDAIKRGYQPVRGTGF
jgi:hypothetical protein